MNTLDVMNSEVAIGKATAFAACIMQSHGGVECGASFAPELPVVYLTLHNARGLGGRSCNLQPMTP